MHLSITARLSKRLSSKSFINERNIFGADLHASTNIAFTELRRNHSQESCASSSRAYSSYYDTKNSSKSSFENTPNSTVFRPHKGIVTPADIAKYKSDSQTLAKWLDTNVIKQHGRVYEPVFQLIPIEDSAPFPITNCSNLDGSNVSVPLDVENGSVRLIGFSFKQYGFMMLRSWLDPFSAEFITSSEVDSKSGHKITALEICFIEYSFLSMAKSVFAANIRKNVSPRMINKTFLKFGGNLVSLL